nr:MAG: hypothetical protein EDM05_08995 [Leptolyngbya sp. IPPAS B-1204]
MEIQQLELDLWQSLEAASRFPETADLRSLCDALEHTLADQSLAEQLTVAGDVLVQLSEVHAARANLLISGWERQHNPVEPVVNLENCVDLFVQSLTLDVSELFEEPGPIQYPANRKQKSSIQEEGSIVGEVEKNALLNWVDQVAADQALNEAQMVEQIRDLAHGENVEEWSRAIARYLQRFGSKILLPDLQQALGMPIVELWLGLLMGGYSLEQQGGFYNSQTLWIINNA